MRRSALFTRSHLLLNVGWWTVELNRLCSKAFAEVADRYLLWWDCSVVLAVDEQSLVEVQR
jgi:hypothetical protein